MLIQEQTCKRVSLLKMMLEWPALHSYTVTSATITYKLQTMDITKSNQLKNTKAELRLTTCVTNLQFSGD